MGPPGRVSFRRSASAAHAISELSSDSVPTLFYSAIAADQCCPILGQAKSVRGHVGNESRCRPNAVVHVTSIPLAGAASEPAGPQLCCMYDGVARTGFAAVFEMPRIKG